MKNNILIIAILLLTFSCKKQASKNAEKVIEKVEEVVVPKPIEIPKLVLNNTIKEHLLGGMWVSKQYDSLLKATHSLTSAEKKLKTYSDIIYNGDSILHCIYPYEQEAHGFKIFNDLSVGYNKNKIDFKITEINENKMTIKYPKGNTFTYYKIEKEIEKEKIFMKIGGGSYIQIQKWFAGKYIFTINDTIHHLIIDENGNVTGKSPYKQCRLFTWYEDNTKKEYDVLNLKTPFEEDNFMVELATKNAYHLQKINTFDGVGETAVLQNSTAILKKDTRKNYDEEKEEGYNYNAISLDELADENYTEPTQSEMTAYVVEKLTLNNNGVYNLDSLQKVYKDKFPKSKFVIVDNSLIHRDSKNNNTYYDNSGGVSNNSEDVTFTMPKHKMYYVFVSNKNEMFAKLMYKNPFYKEVYKPKDDNIYDDNWVSFVNGEQVLVDINCITRIYEINTLFNEKMKNGEDYLYFVKLETEEGNVFYSDVTKIKCIKEYNYSELEKLEEDIHQFETEETKIQEYVFDKNGDKQVLQLVFVDYDKFLFKISANTQTCDSTILGKASDMLSNDEYYVENKSEIKKIIFNKEKTKVKIVMNEDVAVDCCSLIEEVMELVKE